MKLRRIYFICKIQKSFSMNNLGKILFFIIFAFIFFQTTTGYSQVVFRDLSSRTMYPNDIPYPIEVDVSPVFRGCAGNLEEVENTKCFFDKISEFFNRNYNKKLITSGIEDEKRLFNANFIVDTSGRISEIQVFGTMPTLKNEAKRVLQSIPLFKPGIEKGEPIEVQYELHVIFSKVDNNQITILPQRYNLFAVSPSYPEKNSIVNPNDYPVYPGCEKETDMIKKKECTDIKIHSFVAVNFNKQLIQEYAPILSSTVMVEFVIDEKGEIKSINAAGPHKALEKEAERVFNLLPQMQPRMKDGKPVKTELRFPIVFSGPETFPIFPNCEKWDKEISRKRCFSEKIQEHLTAYFNSKAEGEFRKDKTFAVYASFSVDAKGDVVDVEIEGNSSRKFRKEVEKAFKMLPKMRPARKRGRPVSIDYKLPVVMVENKIFQRFPDMEERKRAREHISAESIASFPNCEGINDLTKKKKCFSKEFADIFIEKFNTKLVKNLKLKGTLRIYVGFEIDTHGNFTEIKVRAPRSDLEKETLRVMKLLPKIKPAMEGGKPINFTYSLPIIFAYD